MLWAPPLPQFRFARRDVAFMINTCRTVRGCVSRRSRAEQDAGWIEARADSEASWEGTSRDPSKMARGRAANGLGTKEAGKEGNIFSLTNVHARSVAELSQQPSDAVKVLQWPRVRRGHVFPAERGNKFSRCTRRWRQLRTQTHCNTTHHPPCTPTSAHPAKPPTPHTT